MVEKNPKKPFVLSRSAEEILKAMRFYRYMTALDVCHLRYSPAALTWVRSVLAELSGGADFVGNQYLYRFRLPDVRLGNQKVYTLGSRGREFLESALGISCSWYFRPEKARHLSYGQLMHSLVLTRFLVAAHRWAVQSHGEFTLETVRISYDLAGSPDSASPEKGERRDALPVIPDAWLLLTRKREGTQVSFPVFLEIDRGTMYRQRFKQHVGARLAFIRSGGYEKVFGTKAVRIVYATTGEREEYRETRVRALCAWTREVLEEERLTKWAGIFRFGSVSFGDLYQRLPFGERVWFRPDQEQPVRLFEE